MEYVDDQNFIAMNKYCAVCNMRIGGSSWLYHQRLDAWIHGSCPIDNVFGEDLSTHTMMMGPLRKKDDVSGSN